MKMSIFPALYIDLLKLRRKFHIVLWTLIMYIVVFGLSGIPAQKIPYSEVLAFLKSYFVMFVPILAIALAVMLANSLLIGERLEKSMHYLLIFVKPEEYLLAKLFFMTLLSTTLTFLFIVTVIIYTLLSYGICYSFVGLLRLLGLSTLYCLGFSAILCFVTFAVKKIFRIQILYSMIFLGSFFVATSLPMLLPWVAEYYESMWTFLSLTMLLLYVTFIKMRSRVLLVSLL